MKTISAEYIFTCNSKSEVIKNGYIIFNDFGEIIDVLDEKSFSINYENSNDIKHYNGIICPGFINCHCHLELSYLKKKINKNNGLSAFILDIEKNKSKNIEEIKKAIHKADELMCKNGIVAVADISNTNNTLEIKKNSKIKYYNFIEVFGFNPSSADVKFNEALTVYNDFTNLLGEDNCSIVPHSPYSVSDKLLQMIVNFNEGKKSIISIHNQESEDENKMFLSKEGEIIEHIKKLGIKTETWQATGKNSLESVVLNLSNKTKTLLVHNLFTSNEDIYNANKYFDELFWCFCANSNLFIQNKIPDINLFLSQAQTIVLGTDSLASNENLDILQEIKTINNNFPKIDLVEVFKWATINGANLLNIKDKFGSIEKTKKPGLNFINNTKEGRITYNSEVTKII